MKVRPAMPQPVFDTAAALATGFSPKQLRGPAVSRVLRGVYTSDDQADQITQARAALLSAGDNASLCEVTALGLAEVDLPRRLAGPDEPTHVHVPLAQCGPQHPGLRVHHTRRQLPTVTVADLPSLHLAECWLQVATRSSLAELVTIGDALMRRPRPPDFRPVLVTPAELAEAVATSHRRPGIRLARSAAALVRPGTDSPMESFTRFHLVQAGLPPPAVNYPVLGRNDWPEYFLDMAYPDQQVGVEYDGAVHVGNRPQMEADALRRRRLEDAGWRIVTATARDLTDDMAGIIRSVRRELTARGHPALTRPASSRPTPTRPDPQPGPLPGPARPAPQALVYGLAPFFPAEKGANP